LELLSFIYLTGAQLAFSVGALYSCLFVWTCSFENPDFDLMPLVRLLALSCFIAALVWPAALFLVPAILFITFPTIMYCFEMRPVWQQSV